MQHPFLRSYKYLIVYLAIWFTFGIGYTLFDKGSLDDLEFYLIDNLLDSLLFGLLIIPIWYFARISDLQKTPIRSLIINHISALMLFIVLWFSLGYFLKLALVHNTVFLNQYFWESFINKLFVVKILYFLILLVYYLIIYYNDLKVRMKTESDLKNKVQEAQLSMLKSQINPHFLFNSLNSISSLTLSNPPKAHEMIIKLSDFLRYSISKDSTQKSTLLLELENVNRYLEIEKTRFGERFKYEEKIDPCCFQKTLPVMILQPLFENAIKHGVYDSLEQIKIVIECVCNDNSMIVTICNTYDPDSVKKTGNGIGLKNIRERLMLTYNIDGLMKIKNENNTFEVKLIFPQI